MNIFEIKNLTYKYDKYDENAKYAIEDISFNVEEKDFIAIIGKSGSGKSTLISHLNGIVKANSGEIIYKSKNIYDKNFDLTKLRFSCGLVFQYPEYQLFSETVIEDVAFGAIKQGFSKDEAFEKAIKVMKMLKIENLKDEVPFNLSGGEKRKVALAGVLVMRPEVLVFDEPEAGLDSISKKELFEFLKYLNEEKNITLIFVTHNLDDVVEYANKVLVIDEGKLIKYGIPYDVLSNEELMKKVGLEIPYSIQIIKKLNDENIKNAKFENVVNELTKKLGEK